MNVLSLFDGISVGYFALKRAGITVEKYYASEIDPHAVKVAQLNHPDIIQLGCIKKIKGADLPKIDLMIFGFPCQDLSSIGKGAGLAGERSGLFFEALRLLEEVRPKYFIAENVASMPLAERNRISELLGVEPVMINSELVSAQCRKRLFWCNFKVAQPKYQGIKLQDVISSGFVDRQKSHTLLCNQLPETEVGLTRYLYKSTGQLVFREKYFAELSKETKLDRYINIQKLKQNKVPDKQYKNGMFRHITINEAEALQTLSKDYTAGISKSQRFKCLGNSFTCEVIKHILNHLPKEN